MSPLNKKTAFQCARATAVPLGTQGYPKSPDVAGWKMVLMHLPTLTPHLGFAFPAHRGESQPR